MAEPAAKPWLCLHHFKMAYPRRIKRESLITDTHADGIAAAGAGERSILVCSKAVGTVLNVN
jgi:hypothetical protein